MLVVSSFEKENNIPFSPKERCDERFCLWDFGGLGGDGMCEPGCA